MALHSEGSYEDVLAVWCRGPPPTRRSTTQGHALAIVEAETTTEPKHLVGSKPVPPGMLVDPVFDGMSYDERYTTAFRRLDQGRMLDATCVAITSSATDYSYRKDLVSFRGFAAQLWGRCQHALAVLG